VLLLNLDDPELCVLPYLLCPSMQQDIARHLLFSAHQQQQQAGLTAQLHALRLKCLLQAEQIQLPQPNQQLLSALNEECARLLLSAGASQQAADSR
jgi:hypothetical protein